MDPASETDSTNRQHLLIRPPPSRKCDLTDGRKKEDITSRTTRRKILQDSRKHSDTDMDTDEDLKTKRSRSRTPARRQDDSDLSEVTEDTSDRFKYPKKFARAPAPSLPTLFISPNKFSTLQGPDQDSTTTDADRPDNPEPTNRQTNRQTNPRPRIGAYHFDIQTILDCKSLVKEINNWTKNQIDARCTKTQLIIQPKTLLAHHIIGQTIETIRNDPSTRTLYFTDQPLYFYHRATATPRDKFVIKGLPPKLDTQDLLNEIKDRYNYPIYHISETQKLDTDNTIKHLGLYICETERHLLPTIKNDMTNLSFYKIRIDNYQNKNKVPKCNRCQIFGHTKNYCLRNWVCGKCAGPHDTLKCNNPIISCANCKNNHETSLPNCPTALQAIKDRQDALDKLRTRQYTRSNETVLPSSESPPLNPTSTNITINTPAGRSYADLTSNRTNTTTNDTTTNNLRDLITLVRNCNITKIIQTIKDIINIFKGTEDPLTKLLTVATKVCDFF